MRVIDIEPADGFGESGTVNRAELRICSQPEKTTKRKLPYIPVDQPPEQRRLRESSDGDIERLHAMEVRHKDNTRLTERTTG